MLETTMMHTGTQRMKIVGYREENMDVDFKNFGAPALLFPKRIFCKSLV